MNQRRILGIFFTSLGLIIAVLASIGLAVQPQTLTSDAQAVLIPAIIAFVVVFVLMIIGLYFVVTTNQTAPTAPEMETPLLIVDTLRGRGQITLTDLSIELMLPAQELHIALQEITNLQIFNGYINETRGVISALDPAIIPTISRCIVCNTSLRVQAPYTACNTCHTDYYTTQPL
jgi:hypothetical protein